MISAELMYEKVMHRMDMTKETKEEELQKIIRTVLEDESKKEFIPLSEKIRLSRELFNAFRRLDILQDLIEDDSITEIMVNGTENIFYEKEGKLYRTNRHFFSESRLCDVIQQIVGEANRYVNETSPIVDARLADGSRVNVVLKPVAVNGPIMTIRKFPSKAIKMNDLIKMGSLTKEAAEFIRKIVRSKYTELLEREAEDAFEQRKNLAKKAGEEAGTKLMIPLFLMLIIVFAIVIVPAFFSIRI